MNAAVSPSPNAQAGPDRSGRPRWPGSQPWGQAQALHVPTTPGPASQRHTGGTNSALRAMPGCSRPSSRRPPNALGPLAVGIRGPHCQQLSCCRMAVPPLHTSKQPHSRPTPCHRPSRSGCSQRALEPWGPGAPQTRLPDGSLEEALIGPLPMSLPGCWPRKQPSPRQTRVGVQQEPQPGRLPGPGGPLTEVRGRLDLQLLPLPAASACPAGDLWQAAAMVTTELLCCDLRAGVRSGAVKSQREPAHLSGLLLWVHQAPRFGSDGWGAGRRDSDTGRRAGPRV